MTNFKRKLKDFCDIFYNIIISVFISGFVVIYIIADLNINCTDKSFVDIKSYLNPKNECLYLNKPICNNNSVVFYMSEDLISAKKEMRIYDENNIEIGSFVEKSDGGEEKYRYRYRRCLIF